MFATKKACVSTTLAACLAAVVTSLSAAPMVDDSGKDSPKIVEILARQKGDTLNVYMNSRSAYVNGKSVSPKELALVVENCGKQKALVSAESHVPTSKVSAILTILKEGGINDVGIAVREPSTQEDEDAKIREILSRQEGPSLKIYVNATRTYVNGKSVSPDELAAIIKQSGLKRVVLTAESFVKHKRVTSVMETVQNAGIENIGLVARQSTKQEDSDAKVQEIKARQQGDSLKIYLKPQGSYINGKSVTPAELVRVLQEIAAQSVQISAEATVPHRELSDAIKAVRETGIKQIELSIRE